MTKSDGKFIKDTWLEQYDVVSLGEVTTLRNQIIHPRDNPIGQRTFVGLEHIERNTGRRTDSLQINLEKMSGRRAVFKKGDIVYGYLRPYLNKVWIAEFDGLCSVDQYVFITDEARAIPDYVALYMRSPVFLERAPISETPGQLPRIRSEEVAQVPIPLPPLYEQKRIVESVSASSHKAQKVSAIIGTELRELEAARFGSILAILSDEATLDRDASECLFEISKGIGSEWRNRPIYGATRAGIELAKQKVGKRPERYKPVERETVFYNPMRILIGSIAILDDGRPDGITSPDYVVLRGKQGYLHGRFFYDWLRSQFGVGFIHSMARGAVRERLMFERLAQRKIPVPSWPLQMQHVGLSRAIDRARGLLEGQKINLDAFRSSILGAAFSGQL